MTRVNPGILWEYKIRDYFQAQGYEVVRAAGSKGAVDLVAFNTDETVLVQAKKESKDTNYSYDEYRLRQVTLPPGGKKQLWIKQKTNVTIVELGDTESKIKMINIKDMNQVIQE